MESEFKGKLIRGTVHRPDAVVRDGLALTHGAGSNSDTVFLIAVAKFFAEAGMVVLRYDLPFRVERPKGSPFPAGQARDREGVAEAVAAVRGMVTGRVFAGGHSYGGRQTAMAAAERQGMCDALLLLSYPLHPPDKPQQMRTAYFPELRTPALFVHGSKDPFGGLDELREAIALIPAATALFPVERAGHDLKRAVAVLPEIQTGLLALL